VEAPGVGGVQQARGGQAGARRVSRRWGQVQGWLGACAAWLVHARQHHGARQVVGRRSKQRLLSLWLRVWWRVSQQPCASPTTTASCQPNHTLPISGSQPLTCSTSVAA
jgi:hypothetical protein